MPHFTLIHKDITVTKERIEHVVAAHGNMKLILCEPGESEEFPGFAIVDAEPAVIEKFLAAHSDEWTAQESATVGVDPVDVGPQIDVLKAMDEAEERRRKLGL